MPILIWAQLLFDLNCGHDISQKKFACVCVINVVASKFLKFFHQNEKLGTKMIPRVSSAFRRKKNEKEIFNQWS